MNEPLLPVITPEALAALERPTAEAQGLPGRAYFDPAFFEAERYRVFAPGWLAVGFDSDIPKPGDVKPVTIAGWELILVRGRDGLIRCFHNICRHRGMKVVGHECNVRTLACPYHCWTYGLDGKLLATPALAGIDKARAPEFDYDTLGLLPVRCESWFQFVFVNIDGKAAPLERHLRPAQERIAPSFDLSLVAPGEGGRGGIRDFPVNWKVVLEGSIEDYHLPFVHKAFTHSKEFSTEDGGDVYMGFSSKRSLAESLQRYAAQNASGASLPAFPAMIRSGIAETIVLFLFPNAVLTCTSTYVSTSIMVPLGPERVSYRAQTHFVGDGATDPRFKSLREDNAAFWNDVFNEDDGVWKTIQAMTRVREGLQLQTRFSPHWERAMHGFQKYLAHQLTCVP